MRTLASLVRQILWTRKMAVEDRRREVRGGLVMAAIPALRSAEKLRYGPERSLELYVKFP